ncbi:hypothetical protein B9T29_07455 [Acinetobacter sp. ANC 3903]|uniref:hypothetical protein n=1 Tax=Acinetobacter sp. ANC 3903 TaxID=1977883 RepID=UPI000A354510|nr:hypothetical protein [Acinetobacter sp. ANC 3903]OTG62602.1 hypothetical protein B9T29_07455 [Acinetobacter sp. ANC 3903]
MKLSIDQLVEEIEVLIQELDQNIHFFDSKSTGFAPNLLHENFQHAARIEKFIAYISKYKSNLFRQITAPEGGFYFYPTALSDRFNPYDFVYYNSTDKQFFFTSYQKFSQNVQAFVDVLHQQNQHPDTRTIPEILKEYPNAPNAQVPILDTQLTHVHRQNINFFVDRLRSVINDKEFEDSAKKIVRKTQTKYREYCDYIDELFEKNGDLTFVCLELGLLAGALQMSFSDQSIKSLVELKTKFFNNARNVDPLKRAIGYVGKWEWSTVKGGLYYRIIFIFPTQDVREINALQHALNFYWCEEITHGQGLCHHAYIAAAPAKFKKSFCHIKASNDKERDQFKKRAIGYLTKSEKYYDPPELKQTLKSLLVNKTSDRDSSLTFKSKSRK